MKSTILSLRPALVAGLWLAAAGSLAAADARVDSWFTAFSGRYARIYLNEEDKAAGKTTTTWSNGRNSQSLPAYCGVQEILTSSNFVYILTTGLGSQVMGPWYMNNSHNRLFPNLPVNQKQVFRLPRTPVVPQSRTMAHLGEIGMFVDGVRMFDATDAFSYSTRSGRDADPIGRIGQGDRVWNRDAWVNERQTFDPAYAHQQNMGTYHYHASPVALRYLLGDHVDYDAATKTYRESAGAPQKHSPIIGWLQDGFPLYGPFGYANPTNAGSGLRRMISGFVPRDGRNGTANLAVTGRHSRPQWDARARRASVELSESQYGPNAGAGYPIGHYIEDYEYLGDLGKTPGVDFDLDEFNGRWCVTPEFPRGTYAYFTTISADGTPVYPYNMGRLYYGKPLGGLQGSVTEAVRTNFIGGADAPATLMETVKGNGTVTLVWSAAEGGTYQLESGANGSWTASASTMPAPGAQVKVAVKSMLADSNFRLKRTAVAEYDGATRGGAAGGGFSVSPGSAPRGGYCTVTVNLDPQAEPRLPPPFAPVLEVRMGSLTGTRISHVSRTQVAATFAIPSGAALGAQDVTVVFPGPPGNPEDHVSYTVPHGFTIN